MKWIASLILSLAACGLVFLGLADDPPILAPNPSPTEPTEPPSEPSPCLNAVTIGLAATPSKIDLGQSSTLSWSVEGADECTELQVRLNGEAVGTSGNQKVCPTPRAAIDGTRNTKYTLVVSETRNGVSRQKSASTHVEVSVPAHLVIDQNTCRPAQVLMLAFADDVPNDEQVVELSCGVAIDLTARSITINRDKRMLIASPACARGPRTRNEDVPRIFVKDTKPRIDALHFLFSIHGDHIIFSGFRLQGPTPGIGADPYNEVGIGVGPSDCAPSGPIEDVFQCAIHHIEFSNMEIYHWSGAGIEVGDNVKHQVRGRLFNTFFVDRDHNNNIVGAVHIKNNYFHDNRHDDGEGYGVDVSGGAYALIEQNVFNNNRHAIAGGSKNCDGPPGPPEDPNKFKGLDYSGYTARDNLILPDGGSHCNPSTCDWLGGIVSVVYPPVGIPGWVACRPFDLECAHTHQIDMHGDKNAGPNMGCPKDSCGEHHWPDLNCHNWLCGTAGETIIIERNTILYTGGHYLWDVLSDIFGSRGYAIKIRGDPADKAVVDSNVFKHGSSREAIAQNDNCHGKKTHPIIQANNIFGRDPMKELGSCNFAGYGVGLQDAFMVTGVTWWAWSPVTMQWRYLNTMSEPAADLAKGQQLSDLKLGDMDGDGVCDVAPKIRLPHQPANLYSKSGTGPWVPLNVIQP
jgi:hypothetical protein